MPTFLSRPPASHSRFAPRPRVLGLSLGLLLAVTTMTAACSRTSATQNTQTPTAMGSWPDWQTLAPLIEITAHHVQTDTQKAMQKAGDLLGDGKFVDADRVLAAHGDGLDRQWIAIARADLAALHFTRCIRGIAWRLENAGADGLPSRITDYDPQTKLGPSDVSVEAMLTDLDGIVTSADGALLTQARIARARATAFVTQCPPNDDVAQMAAETMRADLATLVAEDQLTPDLAYLWAGVQMQEFSGSAARPFLLRARDGGFDTPAVDFTLAAIAFERREFDRADELAQRAADRFAELDDDEQWAQAIFMRGEVAMARGASDPARAHYAAALAKVPDHTPSQLGLIQLTAAATGASTASAELHAALTKSMPAPPLDDSKLDTIVRRVEDFAVLTERELDLSEICREAFLIDIDAQPEPAVRGVLYFYAATLDVRLGDYVQARGHAVLARDELETAGRSDLLDIDRFLAHLDGGS